MVRYWLSAILVMFSAQAGACISSIVTTVDDIVVTRGGVVYSITYADIQGNPGTGQHPQRTVDRMQELLDQRITLASLPLDDPDRGEDPALPNFFHGDANGKKVALSSHIIARPCEVVSATWDSAQGYIWQFRVPQ